MSTKAQADIGRQSKVMAVAIILVCGVVGYIALTWLASPPQKQSNVPNVNVNEKGKKIQESPKYSETLQKYNKENAKNAEEQGTSYLSVLSSKTEDVPKAADEKTKTLIQEKTKIIYVVQQQQQQQQTKPSYSPKQLDALLRNWSASPHGIATTIKDTNGYASSLAQNTISNNGSANKVVNKVVDDFTLIPAQLETNIDTDENSVVRATILSGKYVGAELYAMGYKRLNNTVDMTFTFMKLKGRSYKVTAKPVDQNTLRTTLSGEVNNRYFTRIVLPSIFAGIGKIGQLYENSNTTSVITGSGSVVQNSDKPESSAVFGSFIGGVGNQASRVLANDAANIPAKQVLVAARTTIGIQFIGPVLETDDLAVGAINQGENIGNGMGSYPINEPASSPPKQNFSLSPDTESSRSYKLPSNFYTP